MKLKHARVFTTHLLRVAILAAVSPLAGASAGDQIPTAADSPPAPLETIAEHSGFRITGRYDEVERLCRQFEKAFPKAVRSFEFGRTPEGRPMLALAVSRSGALTALEARRRGVPVMLAQAAIHAGEIDGKDAGFLAIREMLQGKAAPGALDSFVLVFVPVLNPDGHERFGPNNRPNQIGPQAMGWRTTSQNYNLNRDYTKADAPETQAVLRLLNEWDPLLYVDLHVSDGAEFQPDISNNIEPRYVGDPGMQPAGRAVLKELNDALAAQGSIPLDFYPSFRNYDDPASGFDAGGYEPRFSTGYWALHNRFALLVETHSWKDYATRVRTTRNLLLTLSKMTAKEGHEWRTLASAADARAEKLGGQEVPLDYGAGPHTTMIDFPGYAYTREPSAIFGSLVTRYDPSKPEVWHVPFRDTVAPQVTLHAPKGAYVIPPAYARLLAPKLSEHGIRFERDDHPVKSAQVEAFRATKVDFANKPFEGRMRAAIQGEWQAERQDIPAGSLIVPIAQPAARLVVALLEPLSWDSYATWGFFNNAFEQQEYMETYVAEDVARDMLAHDPALAAQFKHQLATDPSFAKDPFARLNFFYKRHPSYDERLNLYPIYRIDTPHPRD